MSTILFSDIIFGPVRSRRLGVSLGVNLLPADGKVCSFDCIYCECGYNKDHRTRTKLPSHAEVRKAMEEKFEELIGQGVHPDVITFAGNGEPTMHPHFAEIIDDTIELRNRFFPNARISVLSNALHIGREKIFEALKKVDNNILKLDGGRIETIRLIDRPLLRSYTVERQVRLLQRFEGNFTLQSMFVRGEHEGHRIDNTTPDEVAFWLEVVKQIRPKEVMIYTIDRETPAKNLQKVPLDELKAIARQVEEAGFPTIVAG